MILKQNKIKNQIQIERLANCRDELSEKTTTILKERSKKELNQHFLPEPFFYKHADHLHKCM